MVNRLLLLSAFLFYRLGQRLRTNEQLFVSSEFDSSSRKMSAELDNCNVDESCVLKSVRLHSVILDGPLYINVLSADNSHHGFLKTVAADDRLFILKIRDKLVDILSGGKMGIYRVNYREILFKCLPFFFSLTRQLFVTS